MFALYIFDFFKDNKRQPEKPYIINHVVYFSLKTAL